MKRSEIEGGQEVTYKRQRCTVSRMLGYKVFVVDPSGYEDIVNPQALQPASRRREVAESREQPPQDVVLEFCPHSIRKELLTMAREDKADEKSTWRWADYAAAVVAFGGWHILIATLG